MKVKHIFYETNSSVGGMIKLYNLTMEETQRQNESYKFTFHSDLFFRYIQPFHFITIVNIYRDCTLGNNHKNWTSYEGVKHQFH